MKVPFKHLGHLILNKIQMLREGAKLGWKSKQLNNVAYVFETGGIQYIIHVEKGTVFIVTY